MSAQPRRTARVAAFALAGVLLTAGCAAGQVASTAEQKSSIDGNNTSVGSIDLRAIAIQPPPQLAATYRAGSDAFLNVVLINSGRSDDRLVGIRTSAATSWAYFSDGNDAFNVQQAGNSPSASASESSSESSAATPSGTESTDATESPTTDSSGSTDTSTGTSTDTGSATDSATSSPSSTSSATQLPTGARSVTIPVGGRVGFGTPESTGGLLLTGLTRGLNPGDTVRLTFTFAKAGSVSVAVPVQLSSLPRTAAVPGGDGEG